MKIQKTPVDKSKFSYNRETPQQRDEYIDELPSMTDQSFAEEVNVNSIMAKYNKTGQITHLTRNEGVYADVSMIGDFQTSLDQVELAKHAFSTLPAQLRDDLKNDPANLPGFLADAKNYDKALEYGLVEPRKTPESNLSGVPSTTTESPATPAK